MAMPRTLVGERPAWVIASHEPSIETLLRVWYKSALVLVELVETDIHFSRQFLLRPAPLLAQLLQGKFA